MVLIDEEARFDRYALEWLDQRIDLAERTQELYTWLLSRHVNPTFGPLPLRSIGTPAVRRWHVGIARTRPTTAAKAYRLLSSIMRTAVADGLLETNPCQVRGAAVERAPERPIATMAEVGELAKLMPPDLRIAVVLAAWCQLRRGEVRGLRRMNGVLYQGQQGGMVVASTSYDCGMTRVRLSTTVDEQLLEDARRIHGGKPDSIVIDDALAALLARHRSAQVDAAYAAYDERPLTEHDEWGDLAAFREAAGAS